MKHYIYSKDIDFEISYVLILKILNSKDLVNQS